ncbi:hypothetical protein [Agrobacterium sp. 10MFCol1.1]|uniref:hypothetical protein n=1 Tax=Agrobacterium sp. 10MFCol1.1 TaxID=1150775 RepID=UPI0003776D06|nr:hypothetical protein [Agrobacterium sp. 10MFCol1.1]
MENKPVRDWPKITEKDWYVISISLVLIGLTCFLFASSWVLSAPDLKAMKERVDISSPFATIFLALVTFSTVAWRGLVGARQADQQKAQNDANDDANYAKLLQEGAKLLGDPNKHQDQLAGLATLEVVINEPKRRFSRQALNVVANFYASMHNDVSKDAARAYQTNSSARLAHSVIFNANSSGMKSTIRAKFSAQTPDMRWPGIAGFEHQSYSGGTLTKNALEVISLDSFSVRNAVIHRGNYPVKNGTYDACTFQMSEVSRISEMDYHFDNHRFERCNFSGCKFHDDPADIDEVLNLRKQKNWYDVDNPPQFEREVEWNRFLIPRRRRPDGYFENVDATSDILV